MVQDSCPGTKFPSHHPDISAAIICYLLLNAFKKSTLRNISRHLLRISPLFVYVNNLFFFSNENISVRIRIKSEPYDILVIIVKLSFLFEINYIYAPPISESCSRTSLLFFVCLSDCALFVNFFAPLYIMNLLFETVYYR